MASSSTTLTTKQKVGLEMLSEALEGDFGAAFGVLVKVLGNLVANPDDAKYRKLRTSNAKIQAMLATKGVRALLVGSGFVEEKDALNAESADVATVQAGLEGLQALQVTRASQEAAQKAASMAERNVLHKENRENRETMMKRLADDATMRKEPGWKAQAAGCKDSSKSITSAADIGAQGGGG